MEEHSFEKESKMTAEIASSASSPCIAWVTSLINQSFHTMIPIIFRERRTVISYTITKKRNGGESDAVAFSPVFIF